MQAAGSSCSGAGMCLFSDSVFLSELKSLLRSCFPVFGTRAISHNRFVAKKDMKPFLVPSFGIFLYKCYSSCAIITKRNDLIVCINTTVVESVKKILQTPCSDIASSKKMNKQFWGVEFKKRSKLGLSSFSQRKF